MSMPAMPGKLTKYASQNEKDYALLPFFLQF